MILPKEPKAKRTFISSENLDLMQAKRVISPIDVVQLFNMQCSYYDGPIKDYPTLTFEGSVKIARIRAYDECVPGIVNSVGYEALAEIESTPVFIGVTKIYSKKCTTFVWIPLSSTVYVFENNPFEFVKRPNIFTQNEVKEFKFKQLEYKRGTGFYQPEGKKYEIVQKNTLYRKFKINRYSIEAVEDRVFAKIEWEHRPDVAAFTEECNTCYEPMWLLRNKPEEIA